MGKKACFMKVFLARLYVTIRCSRAVSFFYKLGDFVRERTVAKRDMGRGV